MNKALLGIGKFLLFIGVLVLSLEYLPWWSMPDCGRALLLIGIGFALLILGLVVKKTSAVKREIAKVLAGVLVALALSMAFMTVSVYAGRALGMEFVEPSSQSSVTLGSFQCNGTLILNVTATSFHIRVVRGERTNLTVKMRSPSNLVEEIKGSMSLSYEKGFSGVPSKLHVYTEYERPLILVGFPLYKPELYLEIYVPDDCRIMSAMVESVSGDIEMDVSGIEGVLRTVSGDISARGTFAGLSISSTSGDLNLDVEIKHSGSAQTVSGDIVGHVHASYGTYSNVSGTRGFFASTTSGDVVLELSKEDEVYLNITACTTSGSVRLENIRSLSERVGNLTGVNEREAHGVVGSGLSHEFIVKARSVSGDINLRYVGG